MSSKSTFLSPNLYWSLEDIICDDVDVNVKFAHEAYKLSFLLGKTEHKKSSAAWSESVMDLPEGAEVDVPIWLAIPLVRSEIISVEVPRIFSSKYQDAIIADPMVINLFDKQPYYYEFGQKLYDYLDREVSEGLAAFLLCIFVERVKTILFKGIALGNDQKLFEKKLAYLEKNIYDSAQKHVQYSKVTRHQDESARPTVDLRQLTDKMHITKKLKLT